VSATAVATLVGAAVAGLVAGALWAGVDALRRRAGVPFLPAAGSAAGARRAARDAILLGAALGLAPAALQLLAPFARAGPGRLRRRPSSTDSRRSPSTPCRRSSRSHMGAGGGPPRAPRSPRARHRAAGSRRLAVVALAFGGDAVATADR
jgi:hypothetical protein